jgi:hypothetical protein
MQFEKGPRNDIIVLIESNRRLFLRTAFLLMSPPLNHQWGNGYTG